MSIMISVVAQHRAYSSRHNLPVRLYGNGTHLFIVASEIVAHFPACAEAAVKRTVGVVLRQCVVETSVGIGPPSHDNPLVREDGEGTRLCEGKALLVHEEIGGH